MTGYPFLPPIFSLQFSRHFHDRSLRWRFRERVRFLKIIKSGNTDRSNSVFLLLYQFPKHGHSLVLWWREGGVWNKRTICSHANVAEKMDDP